MSATTPATTTRSGGRRAVPGPRDRPADRTWPRPADVSKADRTMSLRTGILIVVDPMTDLDPGWYRDPDDPKTHRYWNGTGWDQEPLSEDDATGERRPST